MTSMIEKVARASYEKRIEPVRDLEPAWDLLPADHQDRLKESARAAIEVMREPTKEIINATGLWSGAATSFWTAMIDAALEEK
jgi:hypothetical protein